MPIFIQGNPQSAIDFWTRTLTNETKVEYRDRYPDGLDLSPESDLHQRIVGAVLEYANESHTYMSRRHDSWREIDKSLIAYKDVTNMKERDVIAKDPTKPTHLVVPLSFATRETILTHYTSTFMTNPILKYRGIEGRDPITAAKMELIIDQHVRRSKAALSMYSMWSDATSYGIGTGFPLWTRKYGMGTPKDPKAILGPRMLWEGNTLGHVSPYDLLPDPNVSVNNPQDSEHIGFIVHTNFMKLLNRERTDESLFNCQYLKYLQRRSMLEPASADYKDRGKIEWNSRPVDVIYKYINLIPEEWKLGTGVYPEKWLFGVAGDGLVITAEPLGLFYDEFPIAICAPLFDNYSMSPVSLLERIGGLQKFADWLISAHVINVRKALGINIVYDPLAINGEDLKSEELVKLIRMNPTHWGRGDVSKYIQQLTIQDVTSSNISDTGFLLDLTQRVTGVSDVMQGIMRSGGERRSATEAHDAFRSAVSRIQKSAKLISLQAHQDIARMFAYNVQQFMSKEQRIRITGDWQERLEMEYGMSPNDIPRGDLEIQPDDFVDFDYNLIAYDGSVPGEEDTNKWVEFVSPMLANPQAGQAMGLDMKRIFLHISRQLGATSATDFVTRPPVVRTMPDEQVNREAERGNLVPIESESLGRSPFNVAAEGF